MFQPSSIADVNIDTAKHFRAGRDSKNVRYIEERCTIALDAIADRRGDRRMDNRRCFELHGTNLECCSGGYEFATFDRRPVQETPGVSSCIYRARRTLAEAERVVTMGMCDDDRVRRDGAKPMEPIGTAVDHDPRAAAAHQQSTVHLVGSATDLRIAPRSEEVQPDRALR